MPPGGLLRRHTPSHQQRNHSVITQEALAAQSANIDTVSGALRHCVNGGGDVRLGSAPEPGRSWRVGIAHPLRPGDLLAVVEGCDLAVATSGVAERGPHIIDPHTGRPALELASITLVGDDLTTVDAYATAAFAMGDDARDWVRATPGVEALAVTASGRTWRTKGFPAATDWFGGPR
ncbi:FAD:protein FMN transferase [Acrocarpospora sp. B8E8]|uniref:FAD:protein FMN transferase n=1 Tax=Acrocarpospora sp. B8E8 TaxID=3153572 RepID=UPI00325EDFF5